MRAMNETVPKGWFKWERPGDDFPFYNDDTVPGWQGWLLVGVSLFVALILNVPYTIPLDRTIFKFIVVFLIPLVTLLFVARGNMATVIKRPIPKDILLVLGVTVLSLVYGMAMGSFLMLVLGVAGHANPVIAEVGDPMYWLPTCVQLFGEELFKTNLMLGCLLLLFRKTGDRKKSVIVAGFVSIMVFGISHLEAYGSLVQVLLVQGLGGLPFVYAYVKTKNMLVTYAAHVLYDFISFGSALIGAGIGAGALALTLL